MQIGAIWAQIGATWCRLLKLGGGRFNFVQIGATRFRLVHSRKTWCRLVQLGAGWRNLVQFGVTWC